MFDDPDSPEAMDSRGLMFRAARDLANGLPALLAILFDNGRFAYVNPAWTTILGWSAEELLGQPMLDFVFEEDRAHTISATREVASGGKRTFVNRCLRADGTTLPLEWNVAIDVELGLTFALASDLSECDRLKRRGAVLVDELERRSVQLATLLDFARALAVTPLSLERAAEAAAFAVCRGLAVERSAVFVGPRSDLRLATSRGYESMLPSVSLPSEHRSPELFQGLEASVSIVMSPLDKTSGNGIALAVPIRSTPCIGMLVAEDLGAHGFDIDDIAFAEACAALLALCVPLQNDPRCAQATSSLADDAIPMLDREAFNDAVDAAIASATPPAVLAIAFFPNAPIGDVGSFRADVRAVSAVADRLRAIIPAVTISCSDDDTILALVPLDADADPTSIAEAVRNELQNAPIGAGERRPMNGLAIGVASPPSAGKRSVHVVDAAFHALRSARLAGRDVIRVYRKGMENVVSVRRALELDIRRALENDEFFVVFQPIVDAKHHSIIAFEALVRWRHPEAGIIAPSAFIAAAEATGDIVHITRLVLHEAARACRTWQRHASGTIAVNVNVSGIDLVSPGFLDTVAAALRASSLPARYLTIEVTESSLVNDMEKACATLEALRSFGATIALDDFGTGYSSLAYLKRLPVDTLKIDRTFVSEIQKSSSDSVIADAILAIAKKFEVAVTAEGVESAEQAHILRAMGCDSLQGYLFSPPIAAENIDAMLVRGLSLGTPSVFTRITEARHAV
jgi:PAS domain S-box-containing protein